VGNVGYRKLRQIDKIRNWQKTLTNGYNSLLARKTLAKQTNILRTSWTSSFIAQKVSVNHCALNELMLMVHRFSINSMVRGYHECTLIWNPVVGGKLACKCESGKSHDPY